MRFERLARRCRAGLPVVAASICTLACGLVVGPAAAADYPTRPIRLVVPFAPGGITDLIARQVVKGMSERLGQTIIIDNKPGGGHVLSLQIVAQAPADGYTILLGSNTGFTVSPYLYKGSAGVDPKNFVPIAPIDTTPTVVVARPDFPANSLTDLVRIAKAQPGKLTYASFGVGSSSHLGMELFKKDTGIDVTHVPYKGDAPVYVALMGHEVDIGFMTLFSAQSRLQQGELKALGVMQGKRLAAFPGVQTTVEAGSKDSDMPVWIAFFAPAATPKNVLAILEKSTRAVVASPEVVDFLRAHGSEPMTMSNAELTAFIDAQSKKIGPIVEAIGLRPDQ